MAPTKPGPGAQDPQNQPDKFVVPMAQDPAKAAAEAAAKAALEAALQAAAQVTPPSIGDQTSHSAGRTLRMNTNSSDRIPRRNQQYPFVWLRSPGTLLFGITSKWKFVDNAKARKVKVENETIQKIRVARFDEEKLIHAWVTDPLDPDGIEVKETESGLQANIAPWLFREGIAPAPGINQKFDLLDSPELILGLPALCFHMNKAKKTHYFETSGKKEEGGEASAKGNGKRKQDAPGTPTLKVEEPDLDEENE
jgi:hypothetical protein